MIALVAGIAILGLGTAESYAKPPPRPVLTNASRKAAIKAAAATIAAPAASPATDPAKIPHYFGPFPNWANSPLTLPDANVTINGNGSGAAATATVGANGVITGIDITNPGSGYTSATVTIDGGGTGATADAVVSTTGVVTAITVGSAGAGYTAPKVTISGGGGIGSPVTVGNPLITRTYATDYATPPGTLGPVLVVVPTAMPTTGVVTSIQYFNQATVGSSPTPSAGNLFHAYVLHATGVSNEYTVLWDSGEQTVPATNDPVGGVETIPVPNIAVTTGDAIAFYGEGIPVDIVASGTDILSYPAPSAPTAGNTFTLGSGGFPIYPQARTYSIAATVLDTSAVPPLTNATATAYGGVDAVRLVTGGSGYTNPTVDFDLPDDPNGVKATAHVTWDTTTGTITGVVVDQPGSGYAAAPNVVIRNGTIFDPVTGGSGATATATLTIQNVVLDTFGSGYQSAPTVAITDASGTGTGATASASTDFGAVTAVNVTAPGSGYLTAGGIKKFQDGLPMLCDPSVAPPSVGACVANNLGQYLPLAVADTTMFPGGVTTPAADYYVIALVQTRERMSSSLPATGTLLREYVQLETPANASWSKHIPLVNSLPDGTTAPALMPDGITQAYAVDNPHFLGPVIVAKKDTPVRVVFYNLLPKGAAGDLFLPTDSSMMGSGMGPMTMAAPLDDGTITDEIRNPPCTQSPKSSDCFKDNRATLHLHGGITPWISDGTPHQWITPASEDTLWPEGVSVGNVPDMANVLGVPDCSNPADGCSTFYWTNQQSARLMFYHDHAWGITRLNVYAGEAAGYLISDPTEQRLASTGTIPTDQIPLVIQDRTFVPDVAQLAEQDPTWDYTRWGQYGDLWYHHVYMPAQNPGDPGGMSAYGRWMYGPWFWPPATPPHGPIANPYFSATCKLDDPATWQYQTDPFCEPERIPGTPNISAGMEQFNDTPIVNGTAYPTTTVQPKAYRLRILNAANDRFFNLQWYVADPTTGTDSEVALKATELAAAQVDPNVFPTPDTTVSPAGPSWIQIGSEGGFLPAPVVVPNQPITWITDPTRFDVGNVDQHSMLLAPAERSDVIVDFSKFAGKTLILYNDAPAAFPARVASYDYYTGAPDLSPVGAPTILPGYGPNTRTVMQVKVANGTPVPFNLTALTSAFKHKADGSGVFESGQHPIIVGQAAYNSAYGSSFAASSYCNGGSASTVCDGFARIADQGGTLFGFNALRSPTTKLSIKVEPKAIHDEMNSAAFDEFGRMTANIGIETVPATPVAQNITLYPYVNPQTEIIDATNLPKNDIMTPVSAIAGADGTQIWKITHNGVDTHPLHFHLYDVQLLNRVTWDNIIIPPDASELGWKDTVRVSPLEDTIVALRPVIPQLPFELPNSIRPLNPMMPLGDTTMFNSVDVNGNPTAAITNGLVNFGWEYVWHCHILSHEEMDMMRPQSVALPPNAPDGLVPIFGGNGGGQSVTLSWNDNSINETAFVVQRTLDGINWTNVETVRSPLDQPNTHGSRSMVGASTIGTRAYLYRVVANNTVGYGGAFPSLTVQSSSQTLGVNLPTAAPAAPENLTATLQFGPQVSLSWTDIANNEGGFVIERSTDGVNFSQIATAPARTSGNATVTFVDRRVLPNTTYTYRVAAVNLFNGVSTLSAYATSASVPIGGVPDVPTNVKGVSGAAGGQRTAGLSWNAVAGATSYSILWSNNPTMVPATQVNPATSGGQINVGNPSRTVYMQVRANNAVGGSAWTPATPIGVLAQ